MRNVAKIIRDYRKKKKMEVNMLAFKLDMSSSYVYGVECRNIPFPKEKLKAVCKTLSIPKEKMKKAIIEDFKLKMEDYI